MNRRQRKKKSKQQEITIFIGCELMYRKDEYQKMQERIERQIKAGSVVVLPAYLHVEAIIQQRGSRRIEIKRACETGGI